MNLQFICIRKFAGVEWEIYKEKSGKIKSKEFIGVCHKFNLTIESYDWDNLWKSIIIKSKSVRKVRG